MKAMSLPRSPPCFKLKITAIPMPMRYFDLIKLSTKKCKESGIFQLCVSTQRLILIAGNCVVLRARHKPEKRKVSACKIIKEQRGQE